MKLFFQKIFEVKQRGGKRGEASSSLLSRIEQEREVLWKTCCGRRQVCCGRYVVGDVRYIVEDMLWATLGILWKICCGCR